VRADLELFPRALVGVRRAQHRVLVLHRRERNRPSHLGPRPPCGIDDLARRLIEYTIVVSFQADRTIVT
jgi:hypothetical protein